MADEVQDESEYKNVTVYRGLWRVRVQDVELSALYVTSSGDVYGTGYNSLVCTFDKPSIIEYPMIKGGVEKFKKWVKINQLCGLGIRKIVVNNYTVALTRNNEALIWGSDLPKFIDDVLVVIVQEYRPNTICRFCGNHSYTKKVVGGAALCYCVATQKYPTFTSFSQPPADSTRKFVKTEEADTWICGQCVKRNTRNSFIKINSDSVRYCPDCDLIWDLNVNVGVVAKKQGRKLFLRLTQDEGIVDATLDSSGVFMLTANNTIKFTATSRLPTARRWMELPVLNPNNVKIKAIHSTLCSGYLVETEDGQLYWIAQYQTGCRLVIAENMKISLPAAVKKVCPANCIYVCMLTDNSVYLLENRGHPPKRVVSSNGTDSFLDIGAAEIFNKIFIRTEMDLQFDQMLGTEIIRCESDCNRVICEEVCSKPVPCKKKTSSYRTEPRRSVSYEPQNDSKTADRSIPAPDGRQNSLHQSSSITGNQALQPFADAANAASEFRVSPPLPEFQSKLYGQKLLSDVTFKLSDGDFPAHRFVVMTTSTYFQKVLSASEAASQVTLNVTSYNPKVYRCLLKYFYQQEPDKLEPDELFDLYQLARQYQAFSITQELLKDIKYNMNSLNVGRIFAHAKLLGLTEVEKECEMVLKTKKLKDEIMESFIREPTIFLLHPSLMSSVSHDDRQLSASPSERQHPKVSKQTTPAVKAVLLPTFQAQLYGQKQFSDMTIKLSDGDFPAHRFVLMTTSAYFQKLLLATAHKTASHVTHDATVHNPKVFRCLLKHFYQMELDELDLDELFEFHLLADSYEEHRKALETANKIESNINLTTVFHIFGLARFFGIDKIRKLCEILLRTEEAKNLILEKFIDDPIIFLIHPSLLSNT